MRSGPTNFCFAWSGVFRRCLPLRQACHFFQTLFLGAPFLWESHYCTHQALEAKAHRAESLFHQIQIIRSGIHLQAMSGSGDQNSLWCYQWNSQSPMGSNQNIVSTSVKNVKQKQLKSASQSSEALQTLGMAGFWAAKVAAVDMLSFFKVYAH